MTKDEMRLGHIADSIAEIESYVSVGKAAFFQEKMRQNATYKELENIGEAVKNLSEALRDRHPEIPWKNIAGMRDVLIHQYFGIDPEIAWQTVVDELPKLKRVVLEELGE